MIDDAATSIINSLRIDYVKANRCWQANNLKSCLLICDELSVNIQKHLLEEKNRTDSLELNQLKQLVWFLRIRCLADDYYVNESLLLNESDIDSEEDQIRVFSRSTLTAATTTKRHLADSSNKETSSHHITAGRNGTASGSFKSAASSLIRNNNNTGSIVRTAILTGRMPSMVSRQSSGRSRATTSYRPLTTNLTATQTAFSRSTRPLLKYSTCPLLSKVAFEYLYNAQAVTNKCPDYRQCLEYLNLVQNTVRKQKKYLNQAKAPHLRRENSSQRRQDGGMLIRTTTGTDTASEDRRLLGVFWLISFGTCYFNLHMNKQAEEYFQQALSINQRFLDSYTWLVKIYLRTNQPMKVLKICKEGLLYSKNAILYNWLARIQSLMNDLYTANINLRESLKYYPTNIEALANVGHFNFYSDKLEQSLKCFERIQQLSINQSVNLDTEDMSNINYGSSSQLLNNLALCNFYCGFYHKVMPLFSKAFLNSPSKEITSTIWYNISFVPLSFGFKNLTIACLRLALKNDSQNEEAINNLGVLKCRQLVNDEFHYPNRQELWGLDQTTTTAKTTPSNDNVDDDNPNNNIDHYTNGLKNTREQKSTLRELFDEAETYFNRLLDKNDVEHKDVLEDDIFTDNNYYSRQPETLYNMALIKKRRGHLLASVRYCNLYLEQDPNNYHIRNIMKEIKQLVSHDA